MVEISNKLDTVLEITEALQATVNSLTEGTRNMVWNLYYQCSYVAAVNALMMMYISMTHKIPNTYELFKEKHVRLDLVSFVGEANWQALRLTL